MIILSATSLRTLVFLHWILLAMVSFTSSHAHYRWHCYCLIFCPSGISGAGCVRQTILLCKVFLWEEIFVQFRLLMCVVAFADVYERLTPRGKKATFKTLLVTQLVSGIWHGLFAGYVLFFASSAFLFESAKVIYRYEQGLGRRWDFLRTFPPLLFVKFLYTGFVLNYSAIAFLVSLSNCRPTCFVLCAVPNAWPA